MPRLTLHGGFGGSRSRRTRKDRTREHFNKRSAPTTSQIVQSSPQLPLTVSPQPEMTPHPVSCPVCLHEDPGDLCEHLRRYHSVPDMLWTFKAKTGCVSIPRHVVLMKKRDLAQFLAGAVSSGGLTG